MFLDNSFILKRLKLVDEDRILILLLYYIIFNLIFQFVIAGVLGIVSSQNKDSCTVRNQVISLTSETFERKKNLSCSFQKAN